MTNILFELLELMDENTQLVDPLLIDLSVSRACAISTFCPFHLLLYGDLDKKTAR